MEPSKFFISNDFNDLGLSLPSSLDAFVDTLGLSDVEQDSLSLEFDMPSPFYSHLHYFSIKPDTSLHLDEKTDLTHSTDLMPINKSIKTLKPKCATNLIKPQHESCQYFSDSCDNLDLINTSEAGKLYLCKLCGKSFKFQTSLLRHNNKVHISKYTCVTCQRVFSRQSYLDVHTSKPRSSCFVQGHHVNN